MSDGRPESERSHVGQALVVRNLRVELTNGRAIVDNVGFEIAPGEILCLVGESGSGKTSVSTALLGYVRAGARITGGEVLVNGIDLLSMRQTELRPLRGKLIAYIAQDPAATFNPAMRIGNQMIEVARAHGWNPKEAQARALDMLGKVGLPASPAFMSRFPHQLSGGQLQRIGIAIALLLEPKVVIFDEPTTGLDVGTQSRFLALVRQLCTERQIAVLYITHDLAVVAEIADRTVVMLKGSIVEQGPAQALFVRPAHGYTRRLIAAAPDIGAVKPSPIRSSENKNLLRVAGLRSSYSGRAILDGISFDVRCGECLAIVGESGSGKSTLSKTIIGLHSPDSGEILFEGERLAARARDRSVDARRNLQYIFQSPYNSLNPRRTIGASIALAHEIVGGARAKSRRAVAEALVRVALSPEMADLYPEALSGGEKQRASIARALVCQPKLLICDEITSALDVVVQESILELLNDLRRSDGLTTMFVTHNLTVVRHLADRILVLDQGTAAEIGACDDILDRPAHSFTRALVGQTLSINRSMKERWQVHSR